MSVFFDWAESTRISRMSGLTDFDSSSEVFEIAQEFADDMRTPKILNMRLSVMGQSVRKPILSNGSFH